MERIYFKFGTWGRWAKDVVYISHSGNDWNKHINPTELSYWIGYYLENNNEVVFKNN